MIENADYFVRYMDFPVWNCGGFCLLNDDGTYSVYINTRLSQKRQQEALKHEIRHILNGDMFSISPIELIEEGA